MRRPLSSLGRNARGSSASEFALVLPVLIMFLLGILDAGRFMWELNRSEKATQMGVRMAAVTTPVSPGLVAANFASATTPAGALIPASSLGTLLCTSAGCSCEVEPCPLTDMAVDANFTRIVDRMALMNPKITVANVEVRYSGSGFGYAGSPPTGGGGPPTTEVMEISPLITVSLKDMTFDFISLLGIARVNMPKSRATLTAEDSSGTISN